MGEHQLEKSLNWASIVFKKLYLSPELQIPNWVVCISKFGTLTILNLETEDLSEVQQLTNANCCQSLPRKQRSELRLYLVKLQFDCADRQQKSNFLWKMQKHRLCWCFPPPLPSPLRNQDAFCSVSREYECYTTVRHNLNSFSKFCDPAISLFVCSEKWLPPGVPLSSLKYNVAQN